MNPPIQSSPPIDDVGFSLVRHAESGQPDIDELGRGSLAPATASLWAELVIRFWRHALAYGEVDLGVPLKVFDLGAPRASAIRLLLRALRERVPQLGPGASLRYCVCTPSGSLPPAWRLAAELQPWIQDGSLVALRWDVHAGVPHRSNQLELTGQRHCNPSAILARDVWRQLDQQLFAVHHGKLFAADFEPGTTGGAGGVPQVVWTATRESPGGAAASAVLGDYVQRLNSAPVVLSLGAMRVMAQFEALAPGGYMLLATDRGHATEKAIRLSDLEQLLDDFRQERSLPVNFHLLSAFLEQTGAAVWQRAGSRERVLQIAVAGLGDIGSALDDIVGPLEAGPGGDTEDLVRIMQTMVLHGSDEELLAILRHAHHDPLVVVAAGDGLVELLRRPECDRGAWIAALSRVWDNHLPASGEIPLHRYVAPAAMALGAWALARRVLSQGLRMHGEDLTDLLQLAACDASTGRLESAQKLVNKTLEVDPANTAALDFAQRLRAKAQRSESGWRRRLAVPGFPLTLEPLDVDHAEAFFRQYRDPQIATMTRMTRFESADAVRRWIRKTTLASRRMRYAVIHEDLGFVGYVSLRPVGRVGHFGFWTGVDFQGQGLAVQAGRALCDYAQQKDCDTIFAAVFDHNARSLRALQRIGFEPLGLRSRNEPEARSFLYLPAHRAGGLQAARGVFVEYMRQAEPDVEIEDDRRTELPENPGEA